MNFVEQNRLPSENIKIRFKTVTKTEVSSLKTAY